MLHPRQDFAFRRTIALQFVSNDHTRRVLQFLKQLAKKSFGGFFVFSTLNQDVKHVSILINRSPEIVLLTTNCEHHLIQMPFVSTARTTVAQFIGVGLPKLQTPLPDRFIGHHDPSLCQQFLNITKTEREAEIQPNRVADDLRRETKAFVIGSRLVCFHEAILSYCSAASSS